jgi:hypothetical protein
MPKSLLSEVIESNNKCLDVRFGNDAWWRKELGFGGPNPGMPGPRNHNTTQTALAVRLKRKSNA